MTTRYNIKLEHSNIHLGPALARRELLNGVRKYYAGEKLIAMLDLDDQVKPLFGRYLYQILLTGFRYKFYCGGWRFRSKKRLWPVQHGWTNEQISSLFQMPFSWGHARLWWENTSNPIQDTDLSIGQSPLMYCSDIAFIQALYKSIPEIDLYSLERCPYPVYEYVDDTENGTIAKYGSDKRITAQYLLLRG